MQKNGFGRNSRSEALEDQGIELIYIQALEQIYRNATPYIRLHKDPVHSYPEEVSDKKTQVPASSFIPPSPPPKGSSAHDWDDKGVKYYGEYFSYLMFTGYIVIFASTSKKYNGY